MEIEKYLVLNKYLLSLFGTSEFKELQEKLKNAPLGNDSDGKSYFINFLYSSCCELKISQNDLLRYDANIQSYLNKVNFSRHSLKLKYFQYLAVLFAEIYLDNIVNRKQEFLCEINDFAEEYKKDLNLKKIENINFYEQDLNKIAYWMATGAGKTILMHINYYQFINQYKLFSPNNIILITPNEGLSKQHKEEMQKSNIPCSIYSGTLNDGFKNENEVLIIEITKLVEEKKGRGITLPISVFEDKNLIFVDEGHKGKKSDDQKWANIRNKLASNGFTFEYSATFGQILNENKKNNNILQEYSKSIIFDYSYKFFYLDGYGKDFSILNVKGLKKDLNVSEEYFQEIMFCANFLSFYEQILTYEENEIKAKEYNFEKPLWVFVGTTVTGKEEDSDVIRIISFINKVNDDENWFKDKIDIILSGKSGLRQEDGKDIFSNNFLLLKKRAFDVDNVYKLVFGGKGKLEIIELKNSSGEFGLKISENNYFGVVNIGDAAGLKKQLEKINIPVNQDILSDSLFGEIKKENSSMNILIGSKKFIEGWDTWRVSSMGLLHIGSSQGPQIIQLFGRGIRLKGKDMSLQRSQEKTCVDILGVLNIYGIKADYLNKFLEAIGNENADFEKIEIPIEIKHKEKWSELLILKKDEQKKYENEQILNLEFDKKISPVLNFLPGISLYTAQDRKEKENIKKEDIKLKVEKQGFQEREDLIDLIDWDKIYNKIYNYKIEKKFWNLIFDKEILKSILLSYKNLLIPLELLEIKTYKDIERLSDIVLLIIKKYVNLFYKKYANIYECEHLQVKHYQGEQLNLFKNEDESYSYTLEIDKTKKELIKKIKLLAEDLNKLKNIKECEDELPRIIFDRHLFIPILLQSNNEINKIIPEGLTDSENKFIAGLQNYLLNNKEKDNIKKYEIFLLRNFPMSGTGFQLNWSQFYPDFIMWFKDPAKQVIIFIDPKGLEHTQGLDDEKIKFAGFINETDKGENNIITIKQIENRLKENKCNNYNDKNDNDIDIILESFILSYSSYNNLIKNKTNYPTEEDYEKNHVLFLDDKKWPEKLINSFN
ncbi:MAG: DEAD/DEAH box helicase family protein [bacterium]